MSEIDQIQKRLAARYEQQGERGRIVLWRDPEKQYAEQITSMVGADSANPILRDVTLLVLDNNPFTIRYRMFGEKGSRSKKFLVYMPQPEPANADKWLFDLELAYGPVFSADKLTMIATDVFPAAPEDVKKTWLKVMQQYPAFFNSEQRVDNLAKILAKDDTDLDFKAKMIAVLLGIKGGVHNLQSIWAKLLVQYSQNDDTGYQQLERFGLAEFHWSGTERIYHFALNSANKDNSDVKPTVKDFVLWLYQLAWQGFTSPEVDSASYANIKRDWEQWHKDITMRETLRKLSEGVSEELNMSKVIVDMSVDALATRDIYWNVDDILVTKLLEQLGNHEIANVDVQRIIAERERGEKLWPGQLKIKKKYEGIKTASNLRATLEECTKLLDTLESPEQGIQLYADELYKADRAYRQYMIAWQQSGISDVPALDDDLQASYEKYQSDLGEVWQKQIDTLGKWSFEGINAQVEFYKREVAPHLESGRKLVVIISDALRYEVAQELAATIDAESRYTTKLGMQYSVLPSYTQLGMAALLPHQELAFDSDHYSILVDGKSASGLENRNRILNQVNGKAVQAEEIRQLKSDDAKELVRSCDVLYVYHNTIDAAGDSIKSEKDVFDMCNNAIQQLVDIVKRLANGNATNFIITSDHGFLYQDRPLDQTQWLSQRPQGEEIYQKKNRFFIGKHLAKADAFTTFTSEQLGLSNPVNEGITVQVPNSNKQFHIGLPPKRYVHGGAALEEIVVPVLYVNKGRSADGDVRSVAFEIKQRTDRLSTQELTVEFYQKEPVGGKVKPLTVYAGLWAHVEGGGDKLISDEPPVVFDRMSADPSQRHIIATLRLTSDANRFNNKVIELRLRYAVAGSNTYAPLDQRARYMLKLPMMDEDAGFFG